MRSRLVIKIIVAMLAFIFGFFAHAGWTKRHQIIDVLNNLNLYYQD